MSGVTPGLRALLGKLTAFAVTTWGPDSSAPSDADRFKAANLNDAHVTSSLLIEQPEGAHDLADILNEGKDPWDILTVEPRHQVVVDVDMPVHVVESSTPGHHHLYIEVPGGIPQSAYFAWLKASEKIGLIEPGYVRAALSRGHSDVRLPWISKADTQPEPKPLPNLVDILAEPVEADADWAAGVSW